MNISHYINVQRIAKDTMEYLKLCIIEGMTEKEIYLEAERVMMENGAESFWYHNIGALVFVGERSIISASGKEYKASNELVKSEDIVTIDLSPEVKGIWGDFARTFIVSKGKVVGTDSKEIINLHEKCNEYVEGIAVEEFLHGELISKITEEMSFEEVHQVMNELIEEKGYENLDFSKNLGHTIELDKDNRLYIEKGNKARIGNSRLFTFEPHICKKNGKIGFKREDIYYFSDGRLKCI